MYPQAFAAALKAFREVASIVGGSNEATIDVGCPSSLAGPEGECMTLSGSPKSQLVSCKVTCRLLTVIFVVGSPVYNSICTYKPFVKFMGEAVADTYLLTPQQGVLKALVGKSKDPLITVDPPGCSAK